MNRYNNYVRSDSYWFNEVPSHWKKTKNKFILFSEKKEVGEKWEEYDLLTMGKGGVRIRDLEGGGKFPASFENYQTVKPNQIIFCLFDLDETPRTVGLSSQYGMITSAYDVFSCSCETEPRFVNYFYQSIDDVKGLKPYYTGLRKVVRPDTFLGITVYMPSLIEQRLIVDFLDVKIKKIDSLIEKTQRKIELLKEQQIATINHYVTKGLDPSVKMKDSGIEWIGEIPEHWTTSKLKYLSSSGVQYGLNIESESYQDSGVRFMRITDINQDGTIKNEGVYLDLEDVPDGYYLTDGDILFSRSGGTVGKSCLIVDINEPMSFAGYLVRFSFKNKELSNFVKWITESSFYWDWINLQIIQSTIQNVNGEKYSNFSIPLPPSSEMNEISNFLDEIYKKFDQSIILNNKRIDLLKEYRQSLISNVVTGKVRVTEEVI